MAQFEDLIVPVTEAELEQKTLDLAEAQDLPVTGWGLGAWVRKLINVFAEVAVDVWFSVAQLANGFVLGKSKGNWLKVLAGNYQESFLPATFNAGKIKLTDGGGGPHVITVGAVVVGTPDGLQWRNTSDGGGTLPLGGSLDLDFKAIGAGAKYNVANGAITELVTALPTVTVSNPAFGVSGTWITTLGTDAESDEALTARLSAKWATLSTGSPPEAYLFWALSVAGVSRAKVDDGNPDGPGSIRVYIDNAALVATVQGVLNGKIPSGSKATAVAATAQAVTIAGTVKIKRAFRSTAEPAIVANLAALQSAIDIGGEVIKAEVTERIMSPEGVTDFEMASSWTGTPNIQLVSSSYPQFTLALTIVEV